MLVSLTVGKVDAGVAVLLTEDKRLIEFPSILLPPDIHSGSIVDINVSRNQHAELVAQQKFAALQSEIFETFGTQSPSPPVLRCRNATQTSVVLEWDPIQLAAAQLRSLSLYRNGTKAGVIPRDKLSTKISGLALDTEYTFHLVLRTSAGQYASEKLTVRTHRMTDLTGITVTPGIMPNPLKTSLAETVARIGAKLIDGVRIDTTHFVCTEPRGHAWEKAVEMNVPVVVPDWIKGCEREGRLVGVRGYYLDADPKLRQMGPSTMQQQQQNQSQSQIPSQQPQTRHTSTSSAARDGPRIEHTPPTPDRATHARQSSGTEPPTPPPKPASPTSPTDEPRSDQYSLAGTTLKEVGDDEDGDDSEDERSEGTEKGKGHGERTSDESTNDTDDEGKFDEVAL